MLSFSFHVIKPLILITCSDKNYKVGQLATIQQLRLLTIGFYYAWASIPKGNAKHADLDC